ncbi:MAG: hypothetical protein ACRC2U_20930, partial [Aeromonas sp.]
MANEIVPNQYPWQTIAVWFSCGAASAVAAKRTIEQYGQSYNVRVINIPIAEEDPDNQRFLLDVEQWLGQKIESWTHPNWPNSSCVEVWENKKAMSFIHGAPCTTQLKKHARFEWEKRNDCSAMVFGFTLDEQDRLDRMRDLEIMPIIPILIDNHMSKADCF